jgi:DNA replication ATP-dependent helicase Dna2
LYLLGYRPVSLHSGYSRAVAINPKLIISPLFTRRRFDYCIIDEASQITLPTALGPLRFADKFVLVGDHYQLPPIVKNHDARKAGLDVSLFKLLSEKRPESVTSLTFQYRMNEDIMALSNKLIYEGRLKCGSEEVARQVLSLNRPVKLGVDAKMEVKAEAREGGPRCGHEEAACWIGDLMCDE